MLFQIDAQLFWLQVFKRKAELNYKQCGWFSRNYREVEASILDDQQQEVYKISGKWNEQLIMNKVGNAPAHGNTAGPTILWSHTIKKSTDPRFSSIGWTEYTVKLVTIDDELKYILPPTDSRLRPDRYAKDLSMLYGSVDINVCIVGLPWKTKS